MESTRFTNATGSRKWKRPELCYNNVHELLELHMQKKTPFVVISQQSDENSLTMHRYEGKTHVGELTMNITDSNATMISEVAEDYRVRGNAIFGEEPTAPEAA